MTWILKMNKLRHFRQKRPTVWSLCTSIVSPTSASHPYVTQRQQTGIEWPVPSDWKNQQVIQLTVQITQSFWEHLWCWIIHMVDCMYHHAPPVLFCRYKDFLISWQIASYTDIHVSIDPGLFVMPGSYTYIRKSANSLAWPIWSSDRLDRLNRSC